MDTLISILFLISTFSFNIKAEEEIGSEKSLNYSITPSQFAALFPEIFSQDDLDRLENWENQIENQRNNSISLKTKEETTTDIFFDELKGRTSLEDNFSKTDYFLHF